MRRALVCLIILALVLCPGGALGAFSPGFEALSGEYDGGRGVTATLSAVFTTLPTVSKTSLAAINQWLEDAQLTLTAGQDFSAATLTRGGDTALSLAQWTGTQSILALGNRVFLSEEPGGALYALAGLDAPAPVDPKAALDAWRQALPQIYSLLAQKGESTEAAYSTSIRYVGRTSTRASFTLTAQAMNDLWPTLAPLFPLGDELKETLSSIQFDSVLRVKRYRDAAGADMGLEAGGDILVNGDKRELTLVAGADGEGLYLTLSLPAKTGKNTLRLTVWAQVEALSAGTTFKAGASVTRRLGDQRYTLEADASLTSRIKDEGERVTGAIAWTETVNGTKTAWTVKPTLLFADKNAAGDIAFSRRVADKKNLEGTAQVSLAAADIPTAPVLTAETVDLAGLSDEEVAEAMLPALAGLAGTAARLLGSLPEEARALLTHELRTPAWTDITNTVPQPLSGAESSDESRWDVKE